MEQGLGPPQPAWWWRLPTFWCRILDRLVAWDRPLRTCSLLLVIIQMIWFVAFSPCRLSCALCVSLAVKVVLLKLKDMALSTSTGAHLWRQLTASWEELMDSGQDSRSSLGPEVSESFRMFLQETSSFKQQNPGKFCLLVCSVCTFFAVVGRYIPGVVISYILVLGVFLWPLLSSPEFLLWLKPVLQKLDFGFGDFLHRIKENHEKRLLQAQGAEKENIEADLSSMFPKLDSTVCKEMCVSDTDVSDVTWTDNGTFNLSEGHTPQTENSEDLDKEEAFTGGLPEFPSLDNGLSNGDSSSDLSIGLPTPPPLASSDQAPPPPPPHAQDNSGAALGLVQQMASDAIAAAVSSAIQERIEAAVAVMTTADDGQSQRRSPRPKPHPQGRGGKYSSKSTQEVPATVTSLTPFDLAEEEESDSEAEDFELLDQSELEQLQEEELLGGGAAGAEPKRKKAEREPPSSPSSSSAGFFSKLLGRH